jgi:hypothetical protein
MAHSEVHSDEPANTGRDQAGRFTKGHSGNPSGPRGGYRQRASLIAEQLFSADIEKVAKIVVEKAEAGEPWASVLLIRSLLPPAKDGPIQIRLPEVTTAADLPMAMKAIVTAVSEGRLTPAEGIDLASLYDTLRQSFETRDLYEEVERLKTKVAELLHSAPGNGGWNERRRLG